MQIFTLGLILMSIVFGFPSWAESESAISCHCFKERKFDPQKSTASDPYFLATTQNSFMSALFGINKRSLVKAKMGGLGNDELWVIHYLNWRTRIPLKDVVKASRDRNSWHAVIESLGIDQKKLDTRVLAQLEKAEATLAAAIVDVIAIEQIAAEPEQLRELRAAGAGNKEVLLSLFLGLAVNSGASEIFKRITNEQLSWGQLLFEAGFPDGKAIEVQWQEVLVGEK